MNDKKLMIGNLFHDAKGRLCEVTGLDKKEGARFEAIDYPITSFPVKPIPLTEQWLLDFWFVKNEQWFQKEIKGGYNLVINSKCGFAAIEDCILGDFEIPAEVFYVHQLQNLVYILTGQDLIYTPSK